MTSRFGKPFAALLAACLMSVCTLGAALATPVLFGAANLGPGPVSTLYTIDPATGASMPVGPIGFRRVGGMDFHPITGVLYATGFRAAQNVAVLLTIDPATGRGSEIGPTRVDRFCNPDFGGECVQTVTDISFRNADGVLYGYGDAPLPCPAVRAILTFDLASGAASLVGFTGGAGCRGDALAFSPDDELFFLSDQNLSTIDQATGAETPIAAPSYPPCGAEGIPRANALDFHPVTGVAYAAMNASSTTCLITVDPATGVATLIGETIRGLDALAWSFDAIKTRIWLGVANSDDNGRRIDLLVELYKNGDLIARGGVLNRQVAGNALANSTPFDLPLLLTAPADVESGDTLTSRVLVRRRGDSGNFRVRMWYGNGVPPPATRRGWSSLESVVQGAPATLYYRGAACPVAPCTLPLSASPGTAGVASVQTAAPDFRAFGEWSIALP